MNSYRTLNKKTTGYFYHLVISFVYLSQSDQTKLIIKNIWLVLSFNVIIFHLVQCDHIKLSIRYVQVNSNLCLPRTYETDYLNVHL